MARIKKHDIAINIVLISCAVIVISLALSHIIPMSTTAKENLRQAKILIIMTEIDDIAHKEHENLLEKVDSGYSTDRNELFHTIDNKYHTTQYRDEKFKAAMKLNTLIKEQQAFLKQNLDPEEFDSEEQEAFEKLQEEIENL